MNNRGIIAKIENGANTFLLQLKQGPNAVKSDRSAQVAG
jgi:hypothetical protein